MNILEYETGLKHMMFSAFYVPTHAYLGAYRKHWMCPVPHLRPTSARSFLIRNFSFMHLNYGAPGSYANSQKPLIQKNTKIYFT
jgi:hypothetical protein